MAEANPFTARFENGGLREEPLSEEPLPQEPLLEEPEPEKPVPLLDVPLPEVHCWKSHYRMNRWNCHYLIRWSGATARRSAMRRPTPSHRR